MNLRKQIGFWGAAGLIGLLGVVTFTGWLGPCPLCWIGARGGAEASAASLAPSSASVTIEVEGMTCASCTLAVRAAIRRLDGVVDAKVTIDPGRATVSYDASKVQPAKIAEAITDLGYQATLPKERS